MDPNNNVPADPNSQTSPFPSSNPPVPPTTPSDSLTPGATMTPSDSVASTTTQVAADTTSSDVSAGQDTAANFAPSEPPVTDPSSLGTTPPVGFSTMTPPGDSSAAFSSPSPTDLGASAVTPTTPSLDTSSPSSAPSAPTDFASWQPPAASAPLANEPSGLTVDTGSSDDSVSAGLNNSDVSSSFSSGPSISDLAGGSPSPSLGGLSAAVPGIPDLGATVPSTTSETPATEIGNTATASLGDTSGSEPATENPFMATSPFAAPATPPSVAASPAETPPFSSNEPVAPAESAPTDLSHLMSSNTPGSGGSTSASTTIPQPETLVVAPAPVSQDAQVVTGSGSRGFPKWVLAVAAVVLLLVVGGSAYFILGVGQSGQETTSVPAEQQPLTNPPKAVVPTTPVTNGQGSATASAGFGGLSGNTIAPTSTSTASAQNGGASALELLRQRQAK